MEATKYRTLILLLVSLFSQVMISCGDNPEKPIRGGDLTTKFLETVKGNYQDMTGIKYTFSAKGEVFTEDNKAIVITVKNTNNGVYISNDSGEYVDTGSISLDAFKKLPAYNGSSFSLRCNIVTSGKIISVREVPPAKYSSKFDWNLNNVIGANSQTRYFMEVSPAGAEHNQPEVEYSDQFKEEFSKITNNEWKAFGNSFCGSVVQSRNENTWGNSRFDMLSFNSSKIILLGQSSQQFSMVTNQNPLVELSHKYLLRVPEDVNSKPSIERWDVSDYFWDQITPKFLSGQETRNNGVLVGIDFSPKEDFMEVNFLSKSKKFTIHQKRLAKSDSRGKENNCEENISFSVGRINMLKNNKDKFVLQMDKLKLESKKITSQCINTILLLEGADSIEVDMSDMGSGSSRITSIGMTAVKSADSGANENSGLNFAFWTSETLYNKK